MFRRCIGHDCLAIEAGQNVKGEHGVAVPHRIAMHCTEEDPLRRPYGIRRTSARSSSSSEQSHERVLVARHANRIRAREFVQRVTTRGVLELAFVRLDAGRNAYHRGLAHRLQLLQASQYNE